MNGLVVGQHSLALMLWTRRRNAPRSGDDRRAVLLAPLLVSHPVRRAQKWERPLVL